MGKLLKKLRKVGRNLGYANDVEEKWSDFDDDYGEEEEEYEETDYDNYDAEEYYDIEEEEYEDENYEIEEEYDGEDSCEEDEGYEEEDSYEEDEDYEEDDSYEVDSEDYEEDAYDEDEEYVEEDIYDEDMSGEDEGYGGDESGAEEDDYVEEDGYGEEEEYDYEIDGEDYEDEEYDQEDAYGEEENDEYDYEVDGEYSEEDAYDEEEEYDEEVYEEDEEYDEGDYYEVDDEDYEEDAYDKEEYEEEDFYEEDEEYEEDNEEVSERVMGRVIYKFMHMSTVDYILTATGAAIFILAIVTGTMLINTKGRQSQIETFAEIGTGMEDIEMIGERGLVAFSDAQAAKYMAATMEEGQENWENQEGEENGELGQDGATSQKTEVTMNLTSIQKDLKIKFINRKSGKLVSNLDFEVEIVKPSGQTYSMKDEDKDGIIYQTGIDPGQYKVKIIAPDSNEEYFITTEQMTVTVKDTIEYKKVDVSDEVKTEAQVNVTVEDTKVNETVVESANSDTVEWVESTKTLIEGTEKNEESYEKVEMSQVADPGKIAAIGFRLLTAENDELNSVTTDNGNDGGEDSKREEDQGTESTPEPPKSTPEPGKTEKPTEKPTDEPTKEPTKSPVETPAATASPTAATTPTITPAPTATGSPAVTPTPTATSASPTATATPTATPTTTPGDAKNDTTSTLKTTSGETLYIKNSDGSFREAKYADYYTAKEFYRKVSSTSGEYKYTGWQVIGGVTFYFDKDGNKVTGDQIIQGVKYSFNSDGYLNTGSGNLGIDVSKHNGNIDWNEVKNSGVTFVIIRCGYRGSSTGALIEDPMFRSNIQGASKAGLKVGIYFFTQAINEVEAVEEASMVVGLIRGYNIAYPVFLDVEPSNGRADGISKSTRTAVCKAFCQTIQNSGYKAGIYANKTWFNEKIDTPSLTSYKIWLAQYAAAPSYTRTRYDMWQYSSKGKIAGMNGNVDMNISYMGY